MAFDKIKQGKILVEIKIVNTEFGSKFLTFKIVFYILINF